MASRDRSKEALPVGLMTEEELEGYFLLIEEAAQKYERNEIRRECFRVLNGGRTPAPCDRTSNGPPRFMIRSPRGKAK
jgi:hypothetical protein